MDRTCRDAPPVLARATRAGLGLVVALVCACQAPSDLERIARIERSGWGHDAGLAAFVDHPSGGVRVRACRAAARMGGEDALDAMIALVGDRDPEVAAAAAYALERIGTREPRRRRQIGLVLADRLDRPFGDGSPGAAVIYGAARAAVLRALAASPDVGPAGDGLESRIVAHLTAALSDRDAGVRAEAVLGLVRHWDDASREAVLARLGDPDPIVRAHAVETLGAHGGSSSDLVPALSDPDPRVRAEACRALGASPDPAALRALTDRIGGAEWEPSVLVPAILAAGRAAGAAASGSLLPYVHSPSPAVRLALATVAAHDGVVVPLDDLLSLSHDPRGVVRAAVVPALRRAGSAGARARLGEMRADSAAIVRAEVLVDEAPSADLVERLAADDPAALPLCVTRLRFEGPDGDPALVEALIDRLRDADGRVVVATIEALGRAQGSGPASEVLATLYRDRLEPRVAAALVRALADRADGLCELPRFLDHESLAVRRLAFARLWHARDLAGTRGPLGCEVPDRVSLDGVRLRRTRTMPATDQLPRVASIHTTHGDVQLRLLGADAPHTVAGFASRVAAGDLDGTPFVGAFLDSVVIGGGGVEPLAPAHVDDTSVTRTARGSVLALDPTAAGPGGAFLITLRSVSALDGRYPVFARVEGGMAVVDGLDVGDRILGITIR